MWSLMQAILRVILDGFIKARQARKNELEIEKAALEIEEKRRCLSLATLEDVKAIDSKVRELCEKLTRP